MAHAASVRTASMSLGATESAMSSSEVRIIFIRTSCTRSSIAFACGFLMLVGGPRFSILRAGYSAWQNRFFILYARRIFCAQNRFFIKIGVKILLLFCKLFCKQLTQNDAIWGCRKYMSLLKWIMRYYIASELAKRDGQLPLQCNISCPRRTAISLADGHVLGGRPFK